MGDLVWVRIFSFTQSNLRRYFFSPIYLEFLPPFIFYNFFRLPSFSPTKTYRNAWEELIYRKNHQYWSNPRNRARDFLPYMHMPIKKLRVREKDAPYITREWKEAIRKKRKYAKRHQKLQTEESDQLLKQWRNIATSIRRKAMKQYWKERSDELRTNPRTFFKTFTPFLRNKGFGEAAIHLMEGNNIIQYQYEVTELFASYFATIADSIGIGLNTTPDADHPRVKRIENIWSDNVFSFRQVHRSEVLGALEKLNPHNLQVTTSYYQKSFVW